MSEADDRVTAAAWAALATVRDPEIDEPITELGFVESLAVGAGRATARIRLPTYFCAANFAYLMVADARVALSGVEGIDEVDVAVGDHYAAEEINAGVAAAGGFEAAFADEADGELDELRLTFWRKAYVASLEQVCRRLMTGGASADALGELSLGDVPASSQLDRLLTRRLDLGMPTGPGEMLTVDAEGQPIAGGEMANWLTRARPVRVSIAANETFCRGLLRTRYALGELEEELLGTAG